MAKKTGSTVTKQVKFKMKNDTPGALRYEEVDSKGKPRTKDEEGAIIGSLYLRKQAVEGAQPEFVDVTITYKG